MVLLVFIFRKKRNLQDAKSHTICYWWLPNTSPALWLRDGDNMDSRDVLETDHGHRDYTTVDLRTDDAGSACSNSKPRHDRKWGNMDLSPQGRHRYVPTMSIPHPITPSTPSDHSITGNGMVLWCFSAGVFRFPVSYFWFSFHIWVLNS